MNQLSEQLYNDGKRIVQESAYFMVQKQIQDGNDEPGRGAPGPLELSVVLCDDTYIRMLNKEWRDVDAPTDVLAFEMNNEGFDMEEDYDDYVDEDNLEGDRDYLPVTMLGDVVISMDTALRQSQERGHSCLDECRILLVHGVLHLLGYDHELGMSHAFYDVEKG